MGGAQAVFRGGTAPLAPRSDGTAGKTNEWWNKLTMQTLTEVNKT